MEKKQYFTEIVGLRIYLALWVAIGHAMQLAGYLVPRNRIEDVLLRGNDAVIIFMIVSGFVIANLLLVKNETYPRYITRRFFRLFPVYVPLCIAGFLTMGSWFYITQAVPWANDPIWLGYAKSVRALYDEQTQNFLPHLLAHSVMIHGLIPDGVLPVASKVFLPAAWSISLEWQFYLLAPLIVGAATSRSWRLVALLAVALVVLVADRAGLFGRFMPPSAIMGNIHYFLLGIASRLAYNRLAALPVSPLVGAVGSVFVAVALFSVPLPYIIWGVFYSYSLWHRNDRWTGSIFRWLTQSRPVQLLGEASYSLYLVHRPIQVIMVAFALDMMTMTRPMALGIQIIATVIAIGVSLGLYFSIERWGIGMGARVARMLPGGKPAAPYPPAVEIAPPPGPHEAFAKQA